MLGDIFKSMKQFNCIMLKTKETITELSEKLPNQLLHYIENYEIINCIKQEVRKLFWRELFEQQLYIVFKKNTNITGEH